MSLVQAGLVLSLLCICYLWGMTYSRRVEVVDMSWLYKPAIHGDDYKARCLQLWREYKGMRLYSGIVTLVWVVTFMEQYSKGAV